MRRRISSAVGGSNSEEMILSVTLGAYMSAICSASCSVASLMMAGDPLPEASLVMPIAFLRLEGAHSAPSMHHEEALRILQAAKISGASSRLGARSGRRVGAGLPVNLAPALIP